MQISFKNIAKVLKATLFQNSKSQNIDTISIDSRSLQNSTSTLFFALEGNNHDGHNYIAELIEKGVHNFVVQDRKSVV